MAMKRRPPQHRADAKMIFVHKLDESWDHDRIEREQKEMRERGERANEHPVAKYLGGWTRYDLDAQGNVNGKAVTPREYLDVNKPATMWYLRRLAIDDRYTLDNMFEQEIKAGANKPRQTYLRACVLGVDKVENGPELDGKGRLTLDDIDRIIDHYGDDFPLDLGEAAYTASMPLREDEKKA